MAIAANNKVIQKTVEDLFNSLEIDGSFDIEDSAEGADIVVDTKDSGMIIGYHGDTLDSLQLLISLMVAKKLGEFKRITLEVGDYKKNRGDWLKTLAAETKEKVLSENREVFLPNLKSWERRIVHLELQEDDEVISESTGEGRERVLVVRPKN